VGSSDGTASVSVGNSGLGTALMNILLADEIQPGFDPSYQLCKDIYLYHPLGLKMTEWPIRMAQSQPREVTVQNGPDRVRDAFVDEWCALKAEDVIFQVATLARVYGIASVALIAEGVPTYRPVDLKELPNLSVSFNVYDPLNTSGSLVLNQNPGAPDFMKSPGGITVQGQRVHPSRCVVHMNEQPIYIAFTTSAFGFVGRSVYQRALFPMKSFIKTMLTDEMIATKAGLLIMKLKPAGSIVNAAMQALAGVKRTLLKGAATGNVLSVNNEEAVESLNLQNIDGAGGFARKNILENIASAADMPAKILNAETFAEGFGEGTEDAKYVAKYVDRMRRELEPLYAFFTTVAQYRAWTPRFYADLQREFPDQYGRKPYRQAFYEWVNSFETKWPNLLTEPDSEKSEAEKVRHEMVVKTIEVMAPLMDPENKANLLAWAADVLNSNKMMVPTPLEIDVDALREWQPPTPELAAEEQGDEPEAPNPGRGDRANTGAALPRFLPRHRGKGPTHEVVRMIGRDNSTTR